MKNAFAQTDNVRAFVRAMDRAQARGAPEAGIVIVTGDNGYGKTATIEWWAGEFNAVYVRSKAAHTIHWLYGDICNALGVKPKWSTAQRADQISEQLLKSNTAALIIDEVEHCLRDKEIIESIRDLVDFCEMPTVLVGASALLTTISAMPQITTRAAATVHFGPATRHDVRAICDACCDVKVADDLVAAILAASEGRVREIMNALAVVEKIGKRAGGKQVALADLPRNTVLCNNIATQLRTDAQKMRIARREARALATEKAA